jgi:hypothetical protein
MKKLILILALTLSVSFASAQSCCLTVTINCDGSITAVAPTPNQNWVCQMTKGQTSVVTNVPVQADGQTFLFPVGTYSDTISIAFTYHDGFSLGCGYSTYIVNPYLGRTVTGCSGSTTCIVTDIVCPNTPIAPDTTTKRKGRK